jgi:hypothetical protein
MKDSTNKYMVLNNNGEHEYDIIVKETKKGVRITLYSSNNKVWASDARNEKLLSALNTGNEMIFDRKFKRLDYSELFALRLLLKFENKFDTELNQDNFTIIPVKNVIDIK